ncbi:MAG: HPF/RaiA family ribosome-associated protein [Gemmatimonadaceae bacterium]
MRHDDKKQRQRQSRRAAFPATIPRTTKASVGRSTTAETPLHVRARGVVISDALRAYVHERTGFKLGKFGLRIARVSIRFEDVSGSTGNAACVCKFKVVLPRHEQVVVALTGGDPRTTFDAAVDATERAVRRSLDRSRNSRKRR